MSLSLSQYHNVCSCISTPVRLLFLDVEGEHILVELHFLQRAVYR